MWPLTSEECYVSIDIEADGPIPGVHSMLALGAAAFDAEGQLHDSWSANLEQLPEASEHPRTMRWWTKPGSIRVAREGRDRHCGQAACSAKYECSAQPSRQRPHTIAQSG